jgi:hypothetical protein
MCRSIPLKQILLYLFVLFILMPICRLPTSIEHKILAATPSVALQEMKVKPHNWIDMLNKDHTSKGALFT